MKRFAQQFKKQSEKIKLTAEERFLLREKITTFIEYHPLPHQSVSETVISLTDPFVVVRVPWRKWRASMGLVALAIIITIPAVAEYTVPGDILYPVKISLNEEVRSTLARTPYEKVEWESKRIERRISEARVLAKAGLLTPEVENAVVEAVTAHRANANEEIAILRENHNVDDFTLAKMTLASVFEVQSSTFADVETTDEMTATSSTSFKTLAEAIEGGRVEFSARSTNEVISPERLKAEIEKQTTRAYERLNSLKKSLTPQETADINRRLSDIAQRITEANSGVATDGTVNTLILQQALHDTIKLITFMNDIDVRASVAIEDIVPMTLSDEEKVAQFLPKYVTFSETVQQLQEKTASITDADVKEKISFYLPQLLAFIETYNKVDSTNIDDAQATFVEQLEMLASLMQMIDTTSTILPVTEGEGEMIIDSATSSEAVGTSTVQSEEE